MGCGHKNDVPTASVVVSRWQRSAASITVMFIAMSIGNARAGCRQANAGEQAAGRRSFDHDTAAPSAAFFFFFLLLLLLQAIAQADPDVLTLFERKFVRHTNGARGGGLLGLGRGSIILGLELKRLFLPRLRTADAPGSTAQRAPTPGPEPDSDQRLRFVLTSSIRSTK